MVYASTKVPLTILTYLSTKQAVVNEKYKHRPDQLIKDAWAMDYTKELFEQQLNCASPFNMPDNYITPPDSIIDLFMGN